ncbi:MAG: HAD family phosphatase [Sphingobacteriales bacterium]|nr:HAD family phosphatase [Sphingobacteriales bacterium]
MAFTIRGYSGKSKKIAVFDMDNTLLRKSFIYSAAERFGFKNELLGIVTRKINPLIRTRQIARLLKGKNISELLELAGEIPVTDSSQKTIDILKSNGFLVGIMSDSYNCITHYMKNRFSFDFSIGNELGFSKSIATGEIKIHSFYLPHKESICNHEYCKTNALTHICKKFNVVVSDTMVVGDGENDICIIKKSGIGVSFCSTNNFLDTVADFVIKIPDFNLLIPILK